ncbi:hypothetical protein BR93DRAFT_499766 [Coniochaeta sp. PMI_546]|nr:hypothetical protein BR93DRAFT_499766 [Coniochaeta sp. PMI_546]
MGQLTRRKRACFLIWNHRRRAWGVDLGQLPRAVSCSRVPHLTMDWLGKKPRSKRGAYWCFRHTCISEASRLRIHAECGNRVACSWTEPSTLDRTASPSTTALSQSLGFNQDMTPSWLRHRKSSNCEPYVNMGKAERICGKRWRVMAGVRQPTRGTLS